MIDNIPPISLNEHSFSTKEEVGAYLKKNYRSNFESISLNKNRDIIIVPENKPKLTSLAYIKFGNWQSRGLYATVPITAEFVGDLDTIKEIKPNNKANVLTAEPIKQEKGIIHFKSSIPLDIGDNYVPIELVDKRGNKSTFKYYEGVSEVKDDSPQVNIDNNVNVW